MLMCFLRHKQNKKVVLESLNKSQQNNLSNIPRRHNWMFHWSSWYKKIDHLLRMYLQGKHCKWQHLMLQKMIPECTVSTQMLQMMQCRTQVNTVSKSSNQCYSRTFLQCNQDSWQHLIDFETFQWSKASNCMDIPQSNSKLVQEDKGHIDWFRLESNQLHTEFQLEISLHQHKFRCLFPFHHQPEERNLN
jgi:hypothetical protein